MSRCLSLHLLVSDTPFFPNLLMGDSSGHAVAGKDQVAPAGITEEEPIL